MTLAILLVIAALAVLVLEVFFVSFGLLALVAVSLAVGGVLVAFRESQAAGWSMFGVIVVAGPAVVWGAFKILPKLPFGRSFHLDPPHLSETDRRAAAHARNDLLGAEGEAVSPLRPAGKAVFRGEPVQVVTTGPMLAPGTRIKVVEVTGNRIVVEELSAAETRANDA